FAKLLGRMVRDPALLVYLDGQANRKGQPNENLARELMELFTLGVGNYSEKDVKEAARALTGWGIDGAPDNYTRLLKGLSPERCTYPPGRHDDGEKTVRGWRGRWSEGDLVKILLDQPATADRLAWRITGEFLGEGVATREELAALADGLRKTGLD